MSEVQANEKPAAAARPEKPDADKFKQDVEAAEKVLASANARLNAAKEKWEAVRSNKPDSPHAQKSATLRQELGDIRKKQQLHKDARQGNFDKIKKLDETLKARINEQKNARSQVKFKTLDDLEYEIQRLQSQVDTGTMKLVDEKKALSEISLLHKQKRSFAGFDEAQKRIDEIKSQISELRKGQENAEVKALSDRYTAITTELDAIRKQGEDARGNIQSLKDELDKARADQKEKFTSVRDIKDAYHKSRRDYKKHEDEIWRLRKEKQAAERAAFEAGKRREVAQLKLEDASTPAYFEDIIAAENLIRHFDPSALPAKASADPGKFAAVSQRSIDDSAFKGFKVIKKDEEDYFIGGGGKKKGKKGGNAAGPPAGADKFNLSIDVIEQLARINVEAPTSKSHVSIVVNKLKEKIEFWKKDQDRKTKENIEKAKKEIERLETESSASAPANLDSGSKDTHKKPAAANQGANGKVSAEAIHQQEKDAVADAAAELKKANIEDATTA